MDEIGGDPGAPLTSRSAPELFEKADHLIGRVGAKLPLVGRILAHFPLSAEGILVSLAGLALLLLLLPALYRVLRLLRREESNFRGDIIPQSYGLVILIWSATLFFALAFLFPDQRREFHTWLLVILGFGALGLLDDTLGTKKIKGLGGHIRALIHDHRVTTGLIKAVGGILLALWAGYRIYPDALFRAFMAGAIIALAANAINLLDLRPGRAGGCFLLLSLLLLIAVHRSQPGTLPSLLFVVIPTLPVWALDARGKVMMGDTGSNLLGATLGLTIALLSLKTQVAALILLLALHIVTERVSLTRLIEKTPLLNSLDRLTGIR